MIKLPQDSVSDLFDYICLYLMQHFITGTIWLILADVYIIETNHKSYSSVNSSSIITVTLLYYRVYFTFKCIRPEDYNHQYCIAVHLKL